MSELESKLRRQVFGNIDGNAHLLLSASNKPSLFAYSCLVFEVEVAAVAFERYNLQSEK